MDSYKIAICGTPQVGKRTLLIELGRHTGSPHRNVYSEEQANAFLDVKYQNKTLQFAAGCGTYLHPEPMMRHVLTNASAVIYVLSAAFQEKDRPHLSDDEHRNYIDMYLRCAHHVGAGWENIPWLIVLNKTDLASHMPTESRLFPEDISHRYVRCSASKGIGVPGVWQRLLELLHLPLQ